MDSADMRAFYEALKAVYGPSHQIQAPLRSSDGSTLLTDNEAILQRWSEHSEGLFGDRRTVHESSRAKIPQVDVKLELDDPPTREEIRIRIRKRRAFKRERGKEGETGREGLYRRTSGMQSLSLCTKTREKNQTVQTIKASLCSPLQANLGSRLAEQAHPDDSRGKHARKPVWVQVQQMDHRYDPHA